MKRILRTMITQYTSFRQMVGGIFLMFMLCLGGLCKGMAQCDMETSVIAGASTNCVTPNGSLTITYTGSGSYQYSLNGGANTALGASPFVVSSLGPGSYTLVVSDVSNLTCTTTREVAILDSDLSVFANSNSPICATNTLVLFANAGGNGVSYSWSGPNGFVSAQQNPTISNVSSSASGIYSVTVTGSGGCTAVSSTTVAVIAQPNLVIGSTAGTTICSGQSTTLSIGGSNGATVSWSNNLGESGTSISIETGIQTNRGTQPGMIVYTVLASTGGGCTDTQSFSLVVNPVPVINVMPVSAVYCSIEQVKLTATTSGTGTTINWSRTPDTPNPPNASGSGVGTVAIQQALSAGNYTYQFTATGSNGCTSQPTTVPILVQQ